MEEGTFRRYPIGIQDFKICAIMITYMLIRLH